MNDQLRTSHPFKKPVVALYPGYTNTFLFGMWLEVWRNIANNITVKEGRTNWCHLQQLLDQTGSRKPALVSPSPPCTVQPSRSPSEGTAQWGITKPKRENTPGL